MFGFISRVGRKIRGTRISPRITIYKTVREETSKIVFFYTIALVGMVMQQAPLGSKETEQESFFCHVRRAFFRPSDIFGIGYLWNYTLYFDDKTWADKQPGQAGHSHKTIRT